MLEGNMREKSERRKVNAGHEQGVSKMSAKNDGLIGGTDGIRTTIPVLTGRVFLLPLQRLTI
jgi:hypothetical protein